MLGQETTQKENPKTVKVYHERIKLYANTGITGYADYGKIISIVVTIKASVEEGKVNPSDHVLTDKVLEERVCGTITNILIAEHEIVICYHVYADRFGYVDHAKNTTIGVVQTDGVTSAALVVDGLTFQICEYTSSVKQAGALVTAAPSNKVDQADDLESTDSAETETCDSSLLHDPFGDEALTTAGLVSGVSNGNVEDEQKTCDSTKVADEHALILQCDIDKLPSTFAEDAPITIGCGIAVIGRAECGIAKAGDVVETAGSQDELIQIATIGAETPRKISDQVTVGDNTGVSSCGTDCMDTERG